MFYQQNIDLLKRLPIHQVLIEKLEHTSPAEDVAVIPTPAGDYTLVYQDTCLHDPNDALAEVKRVVDIQCHPGENAVHLILGVGLGYLLDEVFHRSSGKIFVYEPDIRFLRFVMENLDLSEYLKSERVFFATGSEMLLNTIEGHYTFGKSLDILFLEGTVNLYQREFTQLTSTLSDFLFRARLNQKIVFANHEQWTRSVIQNIPCFPKCSPFDPFVGAFANKPALIMGAGPSLGQNMEQVRALKDSVVTFACSSTVRPLLETGIVPDFGIFIDYTGSKHQVVDLPPGGEDIYFLISPATEKECLEFPAKETVFVMSDNNVYFEHWLDEVFQMPHHRINGGSTVTIYAIRAAMAMGCNPIILIGQDLAFQGDQFYTGGIEVELDEEAQVIRVLGSETTQAIDYNLAAIKGQNGEMLKTSSSYLVFAKQLEELAKGNQEEANPLRLINASIGGAYLEGFEHLSLQDFREKSTLPPLEKDWSGIDRRLKQYPSSSIKAHRLQTEINRLELSFGQIKNIFESGLAILNDTTLPAEEVLKKVQGHRSQFDAAMERNSFLTIAFHTYAERDRIKTQAIDVTAVQKVNLLRQYFTECLEFLTEKLMKWVESAKQELSQNAPSSTMTAIRLGR